MDRYQLLDGRTPDLRSLEPRDRAFLRELKRMVRDNADYFELYRFALGPGSIALRGGNRVDHQIVGTPLYRVALDLVTRYGIQQGLILAPEFENERPKLQKDVPLISVVQAADLIGISRAAVYKAINKNGLKAIRIGNITVVEKQSALDYWRQRRQDSRRKTTLLGARSFATKPPRVAPRARLRARRP